LSRDRRQHQDRHQGAGRAHRHDAFRRRRRPARQQDRVGRAPDPHSDRRRGGLPGRPFAAQKSRAGLGHAARAPLRHRVEKTRGTGGRRPGRQDRYRLGPSDPLLCAAALSDGEGSSYRCADLRHRGRARWRSRRVHGCDVGAARLRGHAGGGRGRRLMKRVAFIGLGRMGHGMAGRYLEAGFAVAVWNRSRAKAEALIARGAKWATSPEDAAIDADAVVTMVADDDASRAVWLGQDGAAATMKAGTLAIECSTVSYDHALDLARELRSRGLVYIDSPVTGLPDAAAAGNLTLLVGADPADLEKARPFLAPLSVTILYFGGVGSGTVYKLINNLMGAIQIAGIAEGLAIAEQAGLDMKLVVEAIESGVAASPQVIRHSKRMAARNFDGATFTASLRHKDAAYAVALAESLLADAPVMGRAA